MDKTNLTKISDYEWMIPMEGAMRVPGVIFADEGLLGDLDERVREQVMNVAKLPGIVGASYAMPDAHWGYGFPIGGVAAFGGDGVVSAGGVGFDISCGVRACVTGLRVEDFLPVRGVVADALFRVIPAGLGSSGRIELSVEELDAMLEGGARWAVGRGFGVEGDLERIESFGRIVGADSGMVSREAKARQRKEMGTLGSGNHYLEVQEVVEVYDEEVARGFGVSVGGIVVSLHCGSRGLGHQVATEYSKSMLKAAKVYGIELPDRELACAPLASFEGKSYLGAMRAAGNCALANRQILTHLMRGVFGRFFPGVGVDLLYDVSHNMCLEERHVVDGEKRKVFVHRKGATRAFGPGREELPLSLRRFGQPVLIGGSMGTASYILVGGGEGKAFASACHGAGRQMSRTEATRRFGGEEVKRSLGRAGIEIRCSSLRGIAEEAPEAYKDVSAVIEATVRAGLAGKVARLSPLVCVKG